MSAPITFEAAARFVAQVNPDLDATRLIWFADRLFTLGLDVDPVVHAAINTDAVVQLMRKDQKIQAIKELRSVSGCGLKEAKDAVESAEMAKLLSGAA